MLGRIAAPGSVRRRHLQFVWGEERLHVGGDGVEAIRIGTDLDERLDVGDVVTVGAGEALGELDERERRLEVGLGSGDGGDAHLDGRSVEGVARRRTDRR